LFAYFYATQEAFSYTSKLKKRGENVEKFFDTIFAGLGAILGFMYGGLDGMLYALLAFMAVDYITGVLVAIAKKKLSSEVGFKGISKKVLILALVGVAHIVDSQLIKTGAALRTATIFFYISNEGISILENAGKLGLPMPKKLVEVLKQLNTEEETDNDN
jgi:toxin secretion/phage lysis holin